MKLYKLLLSITLLGLFFSCSSDDDENPQLNSEKQITEFSIDGNKAEIDQAGKTVKLDLIQGTDLTKLKPEIKISDKASVNPASGTEMDFTNPVTYTVTAEDGSTQEYSVNITDKKKSLFFISKIIKIEGGNESVDREFIYDDLNRLQRIVFAEGINKHPFDFVYDDKGILSKYIITFSGTQKREFDINYKDKKTIEATNTQDGTKTSHLYNLRDDSLLLLFTESNENEGGGYSFWTRFEYDAKGNMVKAASVDNRTSEYAYDDKNSFLKNLPLPQWITYYILGFSKSPNNVTSFMENQWNQAYTYTYNEFDYPVSYIYRSGQVTTNYKIEYKIVSE